MISLDEREQTLYQAIRQRRIITFRYHDLMRTVLPHLLGVLNEGGHKAIFGYQIGGETNSSDLPNWRYYYLKDITELHATTATFVPQPGYNPNNPVMREITVHA